MSSEERNKQVLKGTQNTTGSKRVIVTGADEVYLALQPPHTSKHQGKQTGALTACGDIISFLESTQLSYGGSER